METLSSAFREQIKQTVVLAKAPTIINETNVYQEADNKILPYLDKIVEELTLPGSGLDGLENLEELFAKAKSGKSCLLLLEHYSNLDLSLFSFLLRKTGSRGEEIANSVIAIAGMKLNEDNPVISALASAYTKLVIYPSRSLQENKDNKAEIIRSNSINRAAMKTLNELKTQGRLVLVFPSGTRFRPWDPSSKKGVREVDSYIKSFDYMCLVAINGVVLHVREGEMTEDGVSKDVVRISVGPVLSCPEFRSKIRDELDTSDSESLREEKKEKKQAVVDAIMDELEKMHIEGEKKRKELLESLT